jgi:hypothetical protein
MTRRLRHPNDMRRDGHPCLPDCRPTPFAFGDGVGDIVPRWTGGRADTEVRPYDGM